MMKKRIFSILLILALLCAAPSVFAAGEQRVFDQAGLLSAGEVTLLEERIAQLRASLDVDIVLLTADEGVYDTMDYADMFYEDNGFGARGNQTGVLFFIDMENRITWISTMGDMIDYIDDPREETIMDDQADYLSSADYYGAFDIALSWTDAFVTDGVGDGHYAYDEGTGEALSPEDYGSNLDYATEDGGLGFGGVMICLAIGLGAGFLVRAIVAGSYKKDFKKVDYAFQEKSDLHLTVNSSICTGKFVTTRIIPKQNPPNNGGGFSGGGSGVHTSSGGGKHGGGGRSF